VARKHTAPDTHRADVDTEVTLFQAHLREKGYKEVTCAWYGNALRRAYLHDGDLLKILRDPHLPRGSRSQLRAAVGHYITWLRRHADSARREWGAELAEGLEELPAHKGISPIPKHPLSNAELRQLREVIKEEPEPLATVLDLLCATGLRVTVDLGNLERRWVEEACQYGTLTMRTKGGDYRSFPALEYKEMFQRLLRYKWGVLWQAISPKSERAYYMCISRTLRRCAGQAGLDPQRVHSHLLRATTATQLLRMGKDITDVQKRLGHKQITTTQIYVSYVEMDEMQADAEALERFREGD
jgi:site-specific recombinase XerD